MTNDSFDFDGEKRSGTAGGGTAVGGTVPKDPLIGKVIGERYLVMSVLGTGGWGRVYEVEHTLLKHRLAMKVLHSRHAFDDDKIVRFKREAKALVALDHPHIARVSDFTVSEDGDFCLMMELLKGSSLATELKERGALSADEAFDIVLQVCSGLSAAHNKHIVHRDIKPDNIWISRDSHGKPVAKVIDFGLASIRDNDGNASMSLTATGETLGTPAYMSPEQCRGRSSDARTDVYSVGCVLYEALTGQQAFVAENVLETMVKHVEGVVDPLGNANPALKDSTSLQSVMDRVLAIEVEDRYQSASELAEDIEALKAGKTIQKSNLFRTKWRKLAQKKSPTSLVFLFGIATVSMVMLPIVAGKRLNYQFFAFQILSLFMVWALLNNARKIFSRDATTAQKQAAGWGCLAYSLMSIAAFPVVCSGWVPLALRKPVWHLYTDNPVVQYGGIATIAVSMFMSFWILKRSAKETDAATADQKN